jgi:hypothetical protein
MATGTPPERQTVTLEIVNGVVDRVLINGHEGHEVDASTRDQFFAQGPQYVSTVLYNAADRGICVHRRCVLVCG